VGHCTSPILRAESGGIETVTEAYDTSSARSLPNISPALAVERFRFVATSTGIRDVPSVSACATGTKAPWDSRPLHPPQQIADAIAAAVKLRNLPINAIPHGPLR
jgi:hypothetical protein